MTNTSSNIDAAVLGDRLRSARSAVSLTQEAAASGLGVARTTLLAMESGKRRIQPAELIKLAELYRTTVGHLIGADSVHVDLVGKFRRLEGAADFAAQEAVALLSRLVAGAIELERSLGVQLRQDYPPPLRISSQGYLQQAEDAAISFRTRLGIGLGKIDDLATLLELELGVRVFHRALDPKVSGVYAYDANVGACILVNTNHHRNRRLQSLAHEGGHFVSDRSSVDVLDQSSFGLTVSERFARRFGAALIMPAPSIRSAFEELQAVGSVDVRGLVLMAHRFGVATEAMCRRLEDLGLLAEGTWLSMQGRGYKSDLERSVLGDAVPEFPPPSLSARLSFLAAEALDRQVLSEGQLCELLVVDRVELRRALKPFSLGD